MSTSTNSDSLSSFNEYFVIGLGNHGSQYTRTRHNAGQLVLEYLSDRLNVAWDRCRGYDQATVSLAAVLHAIEKDKVRAWMPKRPKLGKQPKRKQQKRRVALDAELAAPQDDSGCPARGEAQSAGGAPVVSTTVESDPEIDPHAIQLRLIRLHSFMNVAGDKFRLVLRDSPWNQGDFGPASNKSPDRQRPSMLFLHDHLDKPLGTLSFKSHGSAGGHNGIRSIHATLKSERVERLQVGIGRPADKNQVSEYVLQLFAPGELTGLGCRVAPAAWVLICEWVERIERGDDGVPPLVKVGLSEDD